MLKSTKVSEAPVQFEPEFIAGLREVFERQIAFNQVLGLRITEVLPERV